MKTEKFQPQIAQMNADVSSAGTHLCSASAAKEENVTGGFGARSCL